MPARRKAKVPVKNSQIVESPPPSESEPEPESDTEQTAETDQAAEGKAKKRVYNNFTDDQEEVLVNWLKDNPILYNKRMKEYKNREQKGAMWTEMAFKLDLPESQLRTWYKTMRTQFGRLVTKRSGDGAREMTDRDKWILTSFDFLRSHIVRVTSRQAGGIKAKLARSITAEPEPCDDSDEAEAEMSLVEPTPSATTTTSAASNAPTSSAPKKKKKSQDIDLQDLISKLTERVEGSQEVRDKVTQLLRAMENPHTAYANYLGSMHPSIHPDLWEDYLCKSHDMLLKFVSESKRLRRMEQPQMQQHVFPQMATYSQLQPVMPIRQSTVQVSQSGNTRVGSIDGLWDTPTFGLMSTPNLSQVSVPSVGSSFVRQMDEIQSTLETNPSQADPQSTLKFNQF